ncbi:MAG: hypothetical protein OWR62_11655 [Sulfobacillus thermotolerans]|nr:hypothetical protein [Sulfobacillus thermotolerans]
MRQAETAPHLSDAITPRWLRNYYGVTQIQAGVPLSVVQHRMGHAWVLTTLEYEMVATSRQNSSS